MNDTMKLLLQLKEFSEQEMSEGYLLNRKQAQLLAALIEPDALAYAQFPAMTLGPSGLPVIVG